MIRSGSMHVEDAPDRCAHPSYLTLATFCAELRRAAVFAIALALPAALRAEDWPMFQHNAAHTGATADQISGRLRVAWSFQTGDAISASPVVAAQMVFVGSWDKSIYALHAADGKLAWRFPTAGMICYAACATDGRVVVGSDDQYLHCLDAATGVPRWKARLDGKPWGNPIAVGGKCYITSAEGYLYAFDLASGQQAWRFRLVENRYRRARSTPAASDGLIYCGAETEIPREKGIAWALDAESGAPRWSFRTGGVLMEVGPCVADGTVYVPTLYNPAADDSKANLYALDARTGSVRWVFRDLGYRAAAPGFNALPAIADNRLLAHSEDGGVVLAIDRATGKRGWAWQDPAYNPEVGSNASMILGQNLLVYVPGNAVVLCDSRDGRIVQTFSPPRPQNARYPTRHYPFGQYFIHSSPALSGNRLYIGSGDGVLWAIEGK